MPLIIPGYPVNTNPDRDTLRQRIAEALEREDSLNCGYDHSFASQYGVDDETDGFVDAVLAVLPEPADRAAILAEAADAVFALDYDVMVGEEGDENLGSMREAWDLGTIHAEKLLRRLAAEAPATTKPEHQPRRGDEFEAWLKAQRDEYGTRSSREWRALDEVLDTYRLHADTGTPLGEHVCEGNGCEHQEPAAGARQDGAQSP